MIVDMYKVRNLEESDMRHLRPRHSPRQSGRQERNILNRLNPLERTMAVQRPLLAHHLDMVRMCMKENRDRPKFLAPAPPSHPAGRVASHSAKKKERELVEWVLGLALDLALDLGQHDFSRKLEEFQNLDRHRSSSGCLRIHKLYVERKQFSMMCTRIFLCQALGPWSRNQHWQ